MAFKRGSGFWIARVAATCDVITSDPIVTTKSTVPIVTVMVSVASHVPPMVIVETCLI
jgi:hypothetical protein